jgi:hypothetical protein
MEPDTSRTDDGQNPVQDRQQTPEGNTSNSDTSNIRFKPSRPPRSPSRHKPDTRYYPATVSALFCIKSCSNTGT